MIDILILSGIGAMVYLAVRYIRRQKVRGVHCVGCPDAGHCQGNCSGCGMK